MAGQEDDIVLQISTETSTLKRQLRQLGQDITAATSQWQKSFEKGGASVDKMFAPSSAVQKRINDMVGIAQKGGKEWQGALYDQGKALDDLRKKYNPLYAAQQQYLVNLKDIKTAHSIGAISTNEMAAAVTAEKAAFASRVTYINTANKGLKETGSVAKLTSNQMLNLSRQGNDVITMFALGAPPMQIFASQAGQIYDALESGPGGIKGSLKAIGTSVVGLATKFPLATAAMAAAGVALAAYAIAGGSQIKSLDDIIKSHDSNVKLLGDAWDGAAAKKRNYAALSVGSVNALNDKDIQDAKNLLSGQIKEILDEVYKTVGGGSGNQAPLQRVLQSQFEPFKQALEDLANTNDVKTFIDKIDAIAEVNPKLSSARDELRGLALDAANTAAAIPGLSAPIDEIADTIDKFNRGMAAVNSEPLAKALQDIFDKAKDGTLGVDEINAAIAELNRANPSFSGIIDGLKAIILEARGASQAVANAYAATGGSPNGRHVNKIGLASDRAIANAQYAGSQFIPTPAPNREDLGAAYDKALKKPKAARAPKRTADDRFFEDIEAIRQRTIALAEEAKMVGMGYEAQTKRKIAFDLEQKALKDVREEARKKGDQDWQNAQLTPEQVAKINEVSEAYAAQAENLRLVREAQAEYEDWMNLGRDATRGFIQDLIEGKSAGEAFANVLSKIADKLLDMAMNDLWGGSGGGGGLLGSLFGGLFGGGGGSDPWGGLRANGGPVQAGKAYIVGEKRPELFVPNQSGMIVPRVPDMPSVAVGGGGGAVVVNFSPVIDNRGASVEAVARTQQQLDKLKAELPAHVTAAVRKAQKSNVKLG